jgi:hypothetical protein
MGVPKQGMEIESQRFGFSLGWSMIIPIVPDCTSGKLPSVLLSTALLHVQEATFMQFGNQ